jgi:hypothetical protein
VWCTATATAPCLSLHPAPAHDRRSTKAAVLLCIQVTLELHIAGILKGVSTSSNTRRLVPNGARKIGIPGKRLQKSTHDVYGN